MEVARLGEQLTGLHLLTSSELAPAVCRKAREIGIQAFVMKPISNRVMDETVRKELDTR